MLFYSGQFRNFCDFGLEADYSKNEEISGLIFQRMLTGLLKTAASLFFLV